MTSRAERALDRRRASGLDPSASWIIETSISVNGRLVHENTELSIRGERGRFRFKRLVRRPDTGAVWVDVIGGPKGCEVFRSFHLDRIKTVHRLDRTRANAEEAT